MEQSLQKQMKESKTEYELKMFTNFSQDKSSLFKHLRHLSTSRSIPNLVFLGNTKECRPQQKCDLFNQFFNSVFIPGTSSLPDPHSLPLPTIQLNSISFSESDVWNVLCSLNPYKAAGPDKIIIKRMCCPTYSTFYRIV